VKVVLAGDVMIGRGIDQILPNPSDPRIYEPRATSAREYLRLAELRNGRIPYPVNLDYIWGAALDELRLSAPALYIVNLETAITASDQFLPKGINYRMSPHNAECLAAAGINCCVLANNHILDWDQAGLIETLHTLERLEIETVGAGRNIVEARTPMLFDVSRERRVITYAAASVSSGTPVNWAAGENSPGVNILRDLSENSTAEVARRILEVKRPGDIVIFSIHWGSNWGYSIPQEQVRFAHRLIDEAGVSVVFGHSSHHAKAIERYGDGLILHGCGDFLNDYEGIAGYESYRADLVLLYMISFDNAGDEPVKVDLAPFQIRRFQLVRPSQDDIIWLQSTLDRESSWLGTSVQLLPSGRLAVREA
jgi:poly-gamma-glutamate synthesis protein (capsule biosynthesis protein)